ncbi:hypothetical protein K438DRAFT_1936030 [Mycena galopus ATCC 62051]|nr:hypothetical protein K438DRAFT_1936030 [Mycena galopus ATCC 62051]
MTTDIDTHTQHPSVVIQQPIGTLSIEPEANRNPQPESSDVANVDTEAKPTTVVEQQPRPISPLALYKRAGPSRAAQNSQRVLNVICCPATCPVCACDFMCYMCCEGAIEVRAPGCCTTCTKDCVPCAFIDNFPQRDHALRAYTQCQKYTCLRGLMNVVRAPCWLMAWACAGCPCD